MDSFKGSIEALTLYRTVSLYNQCSGYQWLTRIFFGLLCEGNLSPKVTKEDLERHFGLNSTPYVRSSSWIELAQERSGSSQKYGFITVSEDLASKFALCPFG